MSANGPDSGLLYSCFRATLGVYLTVHFIALIRWGAETFSSEGILAHGDASPLLRAFPNILAVVDSPTAVTALLASAALASMFFTIGLWDRPAAIWCWYSLACLFGRNPLTANPSLPYVGWMLLAHQFLPGRPEGSRAARFAGGNLLAWRMPQPVQQAAWIVMALSYSYGGWTKLSSPSWIDGSAFAELLNNPLARPTALREMLLACPDWIHQSLTWSALALELLFAPLALSARMRPWVWLAMVGMHVGLLVLIDFADLTVGMLLMHAFTFDPSWLRRTSKHQAVNREPKF
jgi:hypothetical protein